MDPSEVSGSQGVLLRGLLQGVFVHLPFRDPLRQVPKAVPAVNVATKVIVRGRWHGQKIRADTGQKY